MTSDRVLIKPTRPSGPGLWFELLGDDEITGGVGGWEDLPRPRRRNAVQWVGTPALSLGLPLLLSGVDQAHTTSALSRRPIHTVFARDTSVESAVRQLTSWGQKTKKTGQPPILRVAGPVRGPQTARWVIEDLEWGPQIRNRDGQRIQQEVTVRLKEYIEAAVVRGPAAASRNRRRKK